MALFKLINASLYGIKTGLKVPVRCNKPLDDLTSHSCDY